MRRLVPLGAALAALAACVPAPRPGSAPAAPAALPDDSVRALLEARDYFRLRDLSGRLPRSPAGALARAELEAAFNRPAESNRVVRDALADDPPDPVRFELLSLEADNHLRLHRYAAAHDAALRALELRAAGDSAEAANLENTARVLAVLRDVPPQTVARRAAVSLRLDRGGLPLAMLPLTVNDSARSYVLDTGANLSTVMRSEAEAAGMRIRPAGFQVGTSTTHRVTADVAVADRVTIGGIELRDVVFLVMDDEMLTFPGGVRIPGIVGFPVLEALGELRLTGRSVLEVPAEAPRREAANLALDGLTPVTAVSWEGEPLVCELDSGANTTRFFHPFFRRFGERVAREAQPDSARYAGAGGAQAYRGYRLRATLAAGDTVVALDGAFVHAQPSADPDEDGYPVCRLGQDVLAAHGAYVLNFRDMAFLLR